MADSAWPILLVDDDPAVLDGLASLLERRGYEVHRASSAAEARAEIERSRPPVGLIDLHLQDGDGIELVQAMREIEPDSAAIIITGEGSVEAAVKAMQGGAFDFVEKPVSPDRLCPVLERAVQFTRFRRQAADMRSELSQLGQTPLIGNSPAMEEVRKRIAQIVRTRSTTTLILGESGTGKELVARAVHHGSVRRKARFVAVNCAALSESLLEAELFGYEKGAFTGAAQGGKMGLFEAANKGTIFLDEIGEMPLELQAKLLRVLEEKRIKRVGGIDDISIDVRVVASTNRDLQREVEAGTFRLDLFYRLNVMTIRMPALRERLEDVPVLANYFLAEFAREFQKTLRGFSDGALTALQSYSYPGNVRELRNIIEHAAIVAPGPIVDRSHLMIESDASRPRRGRIQLELPDVQLATAERELIFYVLEQTGGNRRRTAELLGINRSTLYAKLKQYELTGQTEGRKHVRSRARSSS
ncbi:MAG: sigma-54-dependent Fis family transcriptional regulator [Planctomycetota bacterium]|nr:MAG: sigma-54-dependent Fis family transcriptional regulator [Planctomycetota bacterium]